MLTTSIDDLVTWQSPGVERRVDDLGGGFGSVAKSRWVERCVDDFGQGFGGVAKSRG